MEYVLLLAAFAGIAVGSVTDLKTREVPDWINFALIIAGIGLRLLFSLIYQDPSWIIDGLFGFGLGFAIALVMFYGGQWGGGDSKMLMGLGALLGIPVSLPVSEMLIGWIYEPPALFLFLLYSMVFGAIYGLLWSIGLAIIHRKKFTQDFMERLGTPGSKKMKWVLIIFLIVLLAISFFVQDRVTHILMLSLGAIIVITFYLFIFIRSIEKTCMLKYTSPKDLTIGDWIAEEVRQNGKVLAGPKDLGIEQKQIDKLLALHEKGKLDKVLVKVGIPFVPSFFLAFVATVFFGNSLFAFLL